MKPDLVNRLSWILFIFVLGFFLINWSYVIYPLFTPRGTVGNGLLLLVVSLMWALCARYSLRTLINLKRSLKITILFALPVLLVISIFINSQAYYKNLGDWLRDISNWQINIYYFDWGGYMIFSSLGLFLTLSALLAYSLTRFYSRH